MILPTISVMLQCTMPFLLPIKRTLLFFTLIYSKKNFPWRWCFHKQNRSHASDFNTTLYFCPFRTSYTFTFTDTLLCLTFNLLFTIALPFMSHSEVWYTNGTPQFCFWPPKPFFPFSSVCVLCQGELLHNFLFFR